MHHPVEAVSASPAPSASAPGRAPTRILSIVGTNDLHGRVGSTPVLGGYLTNLRAARARDGGAVLLVDAGDMFQGTLESNLGEGSAVVHAYDALGYAAAAIGNHEFDYGPAGPRATPGGPGDDPRGALRVIASEASFPLLNANLLERSTHVRFPLPKSTPSTVVELAGVRVGLVGVSSSDTLETTISANVSDLEVAPLARTVETEATRLRQTEHCDVVVVLAHAGGSCKTFTGDPVADKCELDSEIFELARALPKGTVDAIVAGHTHQAIAHVIEGIPIIESYSYGRAFGRIDLTLAAAGSSRVVASKVFAPQDLCPPPPSGAPAPREGAADGCVLGQYEGGAVQRDARVAAAIEPDLAKAKERREQRLGVVLTEPVTRRYTEESAEGNLFADLLRKAHPEVAIAMINGGGLRADLPAGALSYGALFEAFPFDNKVALAKLRVGDIEKLFAAHFARGGGILSVSGIHVEVRCETGQLVAHLTRNGKGKPLRPADQLTILASDFMLTNGDQFWGPVKPPPIDTHDELMRDTLEKQLRALKTLRESDAIDPKNPRLVYTGTRPLKCAP